MKPAPIDPPEIHARLWHGFHGQTGWDIGANCGQSLPELTGRFHTVVAFEPAEECQPALSAWHRGIVAPGPGRTGAGQVWVMPIAVSDVDGQVTLAALPDKIDSGQLVSPGTHGMEWNPDVPDAVARSVPSRTIDALAAELGPPDFCKVDVEGHELRVLNGARDTIADGCQWLIEFHTPELYRQCRNLLREERYEVTTVRHPHYRPGTAMYYQHGWLRAFPK